MPWKPTLRTADVVLVKPQTFVGHTIAFAECLGLPWGEVRAFSHAAPILRLEEPLYLPHESTTIPPGIWTVDAVSSGLVWQSVAAQVHAGVEMQVRQVPGAIRRAVSEHRIQARARAWFADEIGRVKYDHARLAWFLFRMPFDWFPPGVRAAGAVAGEVYKTIRTVCSAHTSASLRALMAGADDPETGEPYDPVPSRSDCWTSPSDLGQRDARLENLRDPDGDTVWVLNRSHFQE